MSGNVHTGALSVLANDGTLVPGIDAIDLAGPPLTPQQAFVVGYERMAELARQLPVQRVAAIAVDSVGRIVASAVLAPGERLVVGRHTECGLRLDAPAVSLRQVAVLFRVEDEAPVLRAWDLATGSPFRTEEGRAERAIVSTGPLYLAIERYALWFIPLGGEQGPCPTGAEAAFEALPRRTFVRSEGAAAPRPAPPVEAAGYRVAARPRGDGGLRSIVTGVVPPSALDDDDPGRAIAFLALETATARKRYGLSSERLARGILLGRYGRCDVLLQTPENRVSRIHALLVRLGEATWIVDIASTNGVYDGVERVAARPLVDGDRLALSDELHVEWRDA